MIKEDEEDDKVRRYGRRRSCEKIKKRIKYEKNKGMKKGMHVDDKSVRGGKERWKR